MAVSGGAGFGTFQNKKKLFLALFASILLVTAIVSITVSVSRNKSSNDNSNNINAAHSIIKVSCSSTLYPELCRSTLLAAPDAETSKIDQEPKRCHRKVVEFDNSCCAEQLFIHQETHQQRKEADQTRKDCP